MKEDIVKRCSKNILQSLSMTFVFVTLIAFLVVYLLIEDDFQTALIFFFQIQSSVQYKKNIRPTKVLQTIHLTFYIDATIFTIQRTYITLYYIRLHVCCLRTRSLRRGYKVRRHVGIIEL